MKTERTKAKDAMNRRLHLDWLNQTPDSFGECDGCHADNVKLWALPAELDKEPQACWQYCADCFRKVVKG